MTAQKVSRQMRLQEWARQIEDCEHSGMTVSDWCEQNGVGYKNYYYRKRRIREEFIDTVGTEAVLTLSKGITQAIEAPVFTKLPVSQITDSQGLAATVQIGTYRAEINNGADIDTIDGLLRTLSRL